MSRARKLRRDLAREFRRRPGRRERRGRGNQVTPELNQAYGIGSDTGVLVDEVIAGAPAAKAGVKSGDVIVRLDDRKIVVVEDIFAELRQHKPGETVTLELKRNSETKTVEVELGNLAERPS